MELIHSFLGTGTNMFGPALSPLMQCESLLKKALPFVAPHDVPAPPLLHAPFKFVLLSKRNWTEAFQ
jgi:hypothetical protein